MTDPVRDRSMGQDEVPSMVDRFGVWLSARQIRRAWGARKRARLGDFGCGYHAVVSRELLPACASLLLVDVQVDPALAQDSKVAIIQGALPGVLEGVPDESLDVVLCLSVLEHLWEPQRTLEHLHRIVAHDGVCLVNVPSWRGKRFLELSAFRLGWSPATEMNDHKSYYDPRDLWPMLVKAGFRPQDISCFSHKLGLNTFAACRKPAPGS